MPIGEQLFLSGLFLLATVFAVVNVGDDDKDLPDSAVIPMGLLFIMGFLFTVIGGLMWIWR